MADVESENQKQKCPNLKSCEQKTGFCRQKKEHVQMEMDFLNKLAEIERRKS